MSQKDTIIMVPVNQIHILNPRSNFLNGFTIRGVLVEGIQPDRKGYIKYRVTDLRD